MQQEGVIPVLLRWDAKLEALELVFSGVQAITPGFGGEWEIVEDEVESLETTVKATDKVGTGSNDLRPPAEGLYLGREDWVIEGLVWVGNV